MYRPPEIFDYRTGRSAPVGEMLTAVYPLRVTGRSDGINGNSLFLDYVLPPLPGLVAVVLRAFIVFGASSSTDDSSNYTRVQFLDSPAGNLSLGDPKIATLDTSSGPGAGQPVEKSLGYLLDPQRVVWCRVTRVNTGVDHNNDAYQFGLDLGMFRIGDLEQ